MVAYEYYEYFNILMLFRTRDTKNLRSNILQEFKYVEVIQAKHKVY